MHASLGDGQPSGRAVKNSDGKGKGGFEMDTRFSAQNLGKRLTFGTLSGAEQKSGVAVTRVARRLLVLVP